ncbi:MAG: transglycosylase SLT domain-containing protein [Clostridia bacterium]|nr:transglycosylase SLT domain-containing protein [Clostridia bacterium]MDD4047805.1 transglycosylase SLT domain-containing protein [Clostridia bacterium]
MTFQKRKFPDLVFLYIAVVLISLLCTYTLYQKNISVNQELIKWQNKATNLRNELNTINMYSTIYDTSPKIIATVIRKSKEYDVNSEIMLELINTESEFETQAISKDGAKGLCQLKPTTAKELTQELNLIYKDDALFDIQYNINIGTYYLAKLLKTYHGDYHKALTAYNRGPRGLKNYIIRTGSSISNYSLHITNISH